MSLRMKIAFTCHLLVTIALALTGAVYLFTPKFMPYHSDLVGKTWEQVDPSFQILLLAFLKGIGGSVITIALSMLIILLIPFRQGGRWSKWSVPIIGLCAIAASLYPALYISFKAHVSTHWPSLVFFMVILIVGFLFSLESEKRGIV
jgi:MFS family permease